MRILDDYFSTKKRFIGAAGQGKRGTKGLCWFIIHDMKKLIVMITSLLPALILLSCATMKEMDIAEIPPGRYDLILYGGQFLEDLETVAFLDIPGDRYVLEPLSRDYDYQLRKNLSREDALDKALKFISENNGYWRAMIEEIISPEGAVVGYEVRPLYYTFLYGLPNILDISYRKAGDKIQITIRLIPELENRLLDGDVDREMIY
jgi:hypothetical protein